MQRANRFFDPLQLAQVNILNGNIVPEGDLFFEFFTENDQQFNLCPLLS